MFFRRRKTIGLKSAIIGFALGYALGKSGITDDNVNGLLDIFFKKVLEEKK